jgi:hypothetical protein
LGFESTGGTPFSQVYYMLALGVLAFNCVHAGSVAFAQSFTVKDGETTNGRTMLETNDIGVVDQGGKIETTGASGVMMGEDSSSTGQYFSNAGFITVSGDGDYGVFSLGDDATINSSGDFISSGGHAGGIYSNGNDAEINIGGKISTNGTFGNGIESHGDNAGINANGTINTTGTFGVGIRSSGDDATINAGGSIVTSGNYAWGIYSYGEFADITLTGDVTTSFANADGIYSEGGYAAITVDGIITTSGDMANGILTEGTDAAIEHRGIISTHGAMASAIASTGDRAGITNEGSLFAEGENSHGIFSSGAYLAVTNNGAIDIAGAQASGIFSEGSYANIGNSNRIRAGGESAHAIYSSGAHTEITNTGSLETAGRASNAIVSDGDEVKIVNEGDILTSGISSTGIRISGDDAEIINNGNINVLGTNSRGLFASGANATISTDGNITGTNEGSIGIHSTGDGARIDINGMISMTGEQSHALSVTGANTTVNISGIVHMENDAAINSTGSYFTLNNEGEIFTENNMGVTLNGTHSLLENHGLIHTSGPSASAIWSTGENAEIVNRGSIKSSDHYSSGILVTYGSALVENSGRIISEMHDAITFGSAGHGLSLSAPSYIGGSIALGNYDSEVNIHTGRSHSVLWTFDGSMANGAPNVSGPVPGFYNTATSQFATFDPTGLAGDYNQFANMSMLITHIGRARLGDYRDSGFNFGADLVWQEVMPIVPTATYVSDYTPGFWISGFNGKFDYDATSLTLAQEIGQSGIVAGYNWHHSPEIELGVLGGYIAGTISANSRFAPSLEDETSGWFAGLNTRRHRGNIYLDFGVSGGRLAHRKNRFINDNLALTNGLTLGNSWASASYNSWFLSSGIRLAADINFPDGWTLTPGLSLNHGTQWHDSYRESGAIANAIVAERVLGVVEGRAELAAGRHFDFGRLTARIGYFTNVSVADESASVTLLDNTKDINFGDMRSESAYAGLNTSIDIGAQTEFELDGNILFDGDISGYSAMARVTAKF